MTNSVMFWLGTLFGGLVALCLSLILYIRQKWLGMIKENESQGALEEECRWSGDIIGIRGNLHVNMTASDWVITHVSGIVSGLMRDGYHVRLIPKDAGGPEQAAGISFDMQSVSNTALKDEHNG